MIRQRVDFAVVALLILTVFAYGPALQGGFIWDDADHLTENQAVAAPDGLHKIWSSLAVSRYYPLTLTTFWVQRHIWGLVPLPYHATNIGLHVLNVVLLYLLLRRLQVRGAWLAAALWGVHPVNVESVAWVTELKNTQSGLFFLLCLWCYLQFEERRKWTWYAAALLLFAAALLSKPSTVFLPAALLLCVWWQRGRWHRDDFLRVCPFVALALLMSLLTIVEQQRLLQIEGTADWSLHPAERFVVAGDVVWFYAGKLLWPLDITFVYPRWTINATNPTTWLPLLAAVVAGIICWWQRRSPWGRACAFGLGYYVLALSPVLGFLNIYYFRYSFVADHFNYLASMGFIALVVAGFATVVKHRRVRILTSTAVLAVFGWLTWHHTRIFHDDETLWVDTLGHNPNAALAHNNLGNLYQRRGQLERALVHLQAAAQLNPQYAQIHNNLGVILAKLGHETAAITEFAEALRLKPRYADVHLNLARSFEQQGRLDQAIQHLWTAIDLQPPAADTYLRLSQLLVRTGRYGEAIATLRHGHKAVPSHFHLANELAWLLATCPEANLRSPDEALQLSERLCQETERHIPELLDTLAASYAAAGRFPEAIQTAHQAVVLAEAKQQEPLVEAIKSRLAGYEKQQPAAGLPQ